MKTIRWGIVGLGIAGAALAWRLRLRGQRVVVIDDPNFASSSRVAAGLLTPFTGQRFALSQRWNEFLPIARDFYQQIETISGSMCYAPAPALRLFSAEQFTSIAEPRLERYPQHLSPNAAVSRLGLPEDSTIEMTSAARLDVLTYLAATRATLAAEGDFYPTQLDLPRDLRLGTVGVEIPRLDLKVEKLIFCTGCAALAPWWQLPWEIAKGELLTMDIPGLNLAQVVHREIWIAPRGKDQYQIGATFNRSDRSHQPTTAARQWLLKRLGAITDQPAVVLEQSAGLRPILRGRRPLAAPAPHFPQLWVFTGLGSKGCLLAPYFADSLAAHLLEGTPLDSELAR